VPGGEKVRAAGVRGIRTGTTDAESQMTESAHSQDIVSVEASIPAAPLESILCTDELRKRPRRPPDHEKENSALAALVSALADSPRTILQTLADKILEILDADSAGLSLLMKDGKRFYWAAIAGAWRPHLGGGTPRDFGPCGDVLDHNITMLFTHWERRYPYLGAATPLAEEGLLVPFYVNGKAVGTIWTISHGNHRKFDAEDQRLLESMGRFASAAYQAVQAIEDLKSEAASRESAETELRQLTDSLERQVRIRTQELEQRNSQLAEARGRLAEEKLRLERSEAYMGEAQRLSLTGSWHFNVRTREVVWSHEFFAILGFDPESVKPSYSLHLERTHPEDRARSEQVRSAAMKSKTDYRLEYRLLLPGGLIKYVHAVGHCLVSQSGDVEYIAAVMDITERKRDQEELRRSAAFLAEAQRLSLTGSFSWRVATGEITWSEQLYRIFELDHRIPVTLELIGTRVHPEDISLFNDVFDRARDVGGDFDYEYRLQMPDHSVKYLHVIAHGTRDKDGRLEYIGAAQDVTQRRLSEQALAAARSELAHVTRVTSLGVLTASIAHEVNQPLAAIVTNGESTLRWLTRDEPNIDKVQALAKRMVADAQRASDIVERIRDMASQRAPEQKLLSIDDVIHESLSFLRHELQLKGIVVSLDVARRLPQVAGDRTQLQQVIVNLIINALQATTQLERADHSISVRAMFVDPDTVRCTIEDSGPGIGSEHLPRLFDSFFTTKDAGLGLGLAICRSIVEAHGGRIRADNNSALGGARFILELPASQASAG
jgi:PAS domain S-box-containing protein